MSKHIPRSKSTIIRNRNYKNIELHNKLDSAFKYSSLVNNHVIQSQYENHNLIAAEHPYKYTNVKFSSPKMIQSQISLRKKNSNNPELKLKQSSLSNSPTKQSPIKKFKQMENNDMAQSKDINLMPLSKMRAKSASRLNKFSVPYDSFQPFVARTSKIQDINQLLLSRQQNKQNMNKNIANLKRLIIQQKKKITKLNLACNKHSNGIQRTNTDTRKKQQQSYFYNIQINKLNQNCQDLQNDINYIKSKIYETKDGIYQQKKVKNQTKQYVFQSRIALRRLQEDASNAKSKQSVRYKSMENDYMIMNQLKDDKAKLLNYIQNDVKQHPICKPFGRVQN